MAVVDREIWSQIYLKLRVPLRVPASRPILTWDEDDRPGIQIWHSVRNRIWNQVDNEVMRLDWR